MLSLHPFIHCCFAVDYKKRTEEKRQGDILSNLLNTCPIWQYLYSSFFRDWLNPQNSFNVCFNLVHGLHTHRSLKEWEILWVDPIAATQMSLWETAVAWEGEPHCPNRKQRKKKKILILELKPSWRESAKLPIPWPFWAFHSSPVQRDVSESRCVVLSCSHSLNAPLLDIYSVP